MSIQPQRPSLQYRGSNSITTSTFSSPAVLGALFGVAAASLAAGYSIAKKYLKPSSRITTETKNNVDLEVVHIYEDEAGESHFGVFTIPLADQGPIGM